MSTRDPILSKAIEQAGGFKAVSQALGVSFSAVWQWRRAPVMRVVELERLSGVPREKLRPDVFGHSSRAA